MNSVGLGKEEHCWVARDAPDEAFTGFEDIHAVFEWIRFPKVPLCSRGGVENFATRGDLVRFVVADILIT